MIIAKVGAEALWKFLLYKLTETFPEPLDYSDIVDEPKPQDHYAKIIADFQEYIESLYELAYSKEWEKVTQELESVKCYPSPEYGLMNVDMKNEEIRDRLGKHVIKDANIKNTIVSIKRLLDSLQSIRTLSKDY